MFSFRRFLPLAATAVLAAAAGAWLAMRSGHDVPNLQAGTWLPQRRALHDFALLDAHNRPFGLTQLAAQPSVLFFGFTQCPDVCPTTLAMLAKLRRAANLPRLRVIMISVDPQRDTPTVLLPYVAAFDSQFIGVTGDVSSIAALTRDIGVAALRVPLPGGGYTIDHSATLFLTDGRGQVAAVFTPPFHETTLLADLLTAWPRLED